MSAREWTLRNDLHSIFERSKEIFLELDGSNIYLTGGTGFIGRWLLEAIAYSVDCSNIRIKVTILTRNPNTFASKAPHLFNNKNFTIIEGNVNEALVPHSQYSHLIHAATDASAELNAHNPCLMFDTVLSGTKNVLDFAKTNNVKRVLYLSSGAVYGNQPSDVLKVKEDWFGAPDCLNPINAYAEAKRAAEMLCSIYVKQFGLEISTARIFALLGPLLTLDIHFAAGNFIKDAIEGRAITVNSSGRAVRSYMYPTDLIVALLHLLVNGTSGKGYNIGSDEAISIRDLAKLTADLIGDGKYQILGQDDPGWNPGRYVPDVSKIYHDFGLYRTVSLNDAILNTALSNGWMNVQ
jgi:nucleoside-diphosphate-sugar epimerase